MTSGRSLRCAIPFLRLAALCAHLDPILLLPPHSLRALSADPAWDVYPIGLGASQGGVELRLTDDSHFSSFHRQSRSSRPRHVLFIWHLWSGSTRPWKLLQKSASSSKSTCRGYELPELDGALGIMDRVVGAQIEVSLIPLYEGQPSITQVIPRLESDGLRVAGVINGELHASGEESFFDLLAVHIAWPWI